VWSATGKTVFDAVRHITWESTRKIWWGHNLILVVGDAAARHGLRSVLNWLSSDGEPRRLFWLVVPPGSARDIVAAEIPAAKVPAMAVGDLVKVSRAPSTAPAVNLHQFMRQMSAPMAATTGKLVVQPGLMGNEFLYRGSAVFK